MLFGVRLNNEIYPAWKDHYISYDRLKKLLKESTIGQKVTFTDYDEQQFVSALDQELEKVYGFQTSKYTELQGKIDALEQSLDSQKPGEFNWNKFKIDLDNLLSESKELDHFARLNFTGFQKIIKKHDRLHPNYNSVKALLSIRLKELPFHSEDYSPLLNKLSSMFQILRDNIQSASYLSGSNSLQNPNPDSSVTSINPIDLEYQSFKFWVHPDNLMEVKTRILRHLPVLVYNNAVDDSNSSYDSPDPTITSLYFDNSSFEVYNQKLLKSNSFPSLRLRWSGKLIDTPDIVLEKKIVDKSADETARDVKLRVKEKYLQELIVDHNIDGFKNSTLNKFREMGSSSDYLNNLETDIDDVSDFIHKYNVEPTLRTVYTRTAFEIPGDDRVRITIDSDILFIREDDFDKDRPIRDPSSWHRTDIDSNTDNPYKFLRKSEFSKFPYSVMEIKIKNTTGRKGSELNGISIPFSRKHGKWIEELTTSHLVKEVPNFSKFIQGIASLFLEDDRLDILPFWLPELEDDIRKNPNDALQEAKLKEIKKEDIKSRIERFESQSPRKSSKQQQPQIQQLENDIDEDESSDEDINKPKQSKRSRFLPKSRDEIIPFFIGGSKLDNVDSEDDEVELPAGVLKPKSLLKQAGPVKIEAKVWLANERTFNRWLTVTSLFSALTFSIYSSVKRSENPHLATNLAYLYFGLTIFCCIWGYFIYNKRLTLIKLRDGKHLDAPLGPLLVSLGVLGAIVINFIVGFKDAASRLNANELDDLHPVIKAVNEQIFRLVGAEGY